jgi:hypothetical protein
VERNETVSIVTAMLFVAFFVAISAFAPFLGNCLVVNNTVGVNGFHSAQFGVVSLLKINYKHLPPACDTVPEPTCLAEASGDIASAIAAHEQRIETCGGHGWKRTMVLGEGRVAPVWSMMTPCGSPVAAKFARLPSALEHVSRDCFILKKLSRRIDDPDCNGCFPKYFYHSNYTGVCYSELVRAVPMTDFLNHINVTQPGILLDIVKLAFHQGLSILQILQEEGVKHQDLSFRNVMVRISDSGALPPFRVLFLDFGGSYVNELGQTQKASTGGLGNKGRPDAFAWPCAFYRHFFSAALCREIPQGYVAGESNSLQRALLQMMHETVRVSFGSVDYSIFQRRLLSIRSL